MRHSQKPLLCWPNLSPSMTSSALSSLGIDKAPFPKNYPMDKNTKKSNLSRSVSNSLTSSKNGSLGSFAVIAELNTEHPRLKASVRPSFDEGQANGVPYHFNFFLSVS